MDIMARRDKYLVAAFWILLTYSVGYASAADFQFSSFEGQYEANFLEIIGDSCTDQYQLYLTRPASAMVNNISIGQDKTNRFIMPLLDCILSRTSETIKSNMASAQVILGLAPTILASLGPSTEETSTLWVIGRRPLLALCISLGTPAVYPARAFDYQNPLKSLLQERQGRWRLPRHVLGGRMVMDIIVTVVEYTFVLAALANMIQLGVELKDKVTSAFAPEMTYLPLLWALLGLVIHCLAASALYLRAHVSGGQRSSNRLLNLVKIHFTPLIHLRPLYVVLERETLLYIAMMWVASLSTVCHIIFGTLVFSSMMFISVRDSVYVIGRLMISALCCRAVLMYELAALRDSFNLGDEDAGNMPGEDSGQPSPALNHSSPAWTPLRPKLARTWLVFHYTFLMLLILTAEQGKQ